MSVMGYSPFDKLHAEEFKTLRSRYRRHVFLQFISPSSSLLTHSLNRRTVHPFSHSHPPPRHRRGCRRELYRRTLHLLLYTISYHYTRSQPFLLSKTIPPRSEYKALATLQTRAPDHSHYLPYLPSHHIF